MTAATSDSNNDKTSNCNVNLAEIDLGTETLPEYNAHHHHNNINNNANDNVIPVAFPLANEKIDHYNNSNNDINNNNSNIPTAQPVHVFNNNIPIVTNTTSQLHNNDYNPNDCNVNTAYINSKTNNEYNIDLNEFDNINKDGNDEVKFRSKANASKEYIFNV
eukprot:Pgem_evm1s6183